MLKERKRPAKKSVVADNKNSSAVSEENKVVEPAPETEVLKDADSAVPDEVSATGSDQLDLTEGDVEQVNPLDESVTSDGEPIEQKPSDEKPVTTDSQKLNPSKSSPSVDMSDSVDGKPEETSTNSETITDQILQDLEKQAKDLPAIPEKKEYVSPPDYEYRGRGLVYNCVGKHWACVDAPSFKSCEENASSVRYLQRPTECHPFNVYETVRGCEDMQNRMVSSSAKTDFCQD
jgi:hypothetical protein